MSARRPLRIAALALVLAASLPAAAALAAAPRVHTMVVGKSRTLFGPRWVPAPAASLTASGRRCRVATGTGLAALLAARRAGGPTVRVRDTARSCSRRVADAAGLYVFQVGRDRARGRDGWVYKVGRRLATAGAGDITGPFGTGRRLRTGDRLTWFWCRLARSGSCPRTLETRSARRVRPRAVLHVAVTGFDDRGRGRRIAGATVRLGGSRAATNRSGVAAVRAPRARGRVRLTATRRGMVRAFPVEVVIG